MHSKGILLGCWAFFEESSLVNNETVISSSTSIEIRIRIHRHYLHNDDCIFESSVLKRLSRMNLLSFSCKWWCRFELLRWQEKEEESSQKNRKWKQELKMTKDISLFFCLLFFVLLISLKKQQKRRIDDYIARASTHPLIVFRNWAAESTSWSGKALVSTFEWKDEMWGTKRTRE